MKIINCKFSGFYDVFVGIGWCNWTRVQVKRFPAGLKLQFVSGNKLPKPVWDDLEKKLIH